MLYYGRPDEIAKAIRREVELLQGLAGRHSRLDRFIRRKSALLSECLKALEKLDADLEYQLIAVERCEVVPL